MHVACKNCGNKIAVAGRPSGTTSLHNVGVEGDVNVEGGKISFGPGDGKISFGPEGRVGLGPPVESQFSCLQCGTTADYAPEEIADD